jgi:hypothetical protein
MFSTPATRNKGQPTRARKSLDSPEQRQSRGGLQAIVAKDYS